jgi:hypothetical protein
MPLSREQWREVMADVEDDLAMARENAVAAAQIDLSSEPGLERMAAAAFSASAPTRPAKPHWSVWPKRLEIYQPIRPPTTKTCWTSMPALGTTFAQHSFRSPPWRTLIR